MDVNNKFYLLVDVKDGVPTIIAKSYNKQNLENHREENNICSFIVDAIESDYVLLHYSADGVLVYGDYEDDIEKLRDEMKQESSKYLSQKFTNTDSICSHENLFLIRVDKDTYVSWTILNMLEVKEL